MVPRIGHESHDRNSRLFERFVLSHSMAVTFVVYCKTQLLFRDLIGHSIIQADNVSIHRARTSTLNIEARPRKGSACNALLSCAGFLNQPCVLAAFLPQLRHRKNGRKSITVSSGMIASFRAAGNPKRYIEADMRIRKPLNARDTKVT